MTSKPTKQGMGRFFVAVALTEEVRKALVNHLSIGTNGRPLPGRSPHPENWHITLRFLGDISIDVRDSLIEVMEKTDLGRCFELGFGGLGAFPKARRATVLWIGFQTGHERLTQLATVVETRVVALGFTPENRPFHPHLTLSRIRPPQDVVNLIKDLGTFSIKMNVQEVVLYQSHLRPQGPLYEAVEKFQLVQG